MRVRIKINEREDVADLVAFLRWCGYDAKPAGDGVIEVFANGDYDLRERLGVYIAWWRARAAGG